MSSTSTTIPEAKEALAQFFIDAWTPTGHAFTLRNEDFSPPDEKDPPPWARFTNRITASTQHTLGPKVAGQPGHRKFERTGSAFIQIYTGQDIGEDLAAELTAVIMTAFEGERIPDTTICFRDVIPRETGATGKWYQVTIEAVFEYIEIK